MKPILSALLLVFPLFAQTNSTSPGVPARFVVSVEQKAGTQTLVGSGDVLAYLNNQRIPAITTWRPLGADRSGMQFWILIDDGDSTVLGTQLNDLKTFIAEQPAGEQVGVGYMQNGMVRVAREPTMDHQAAQKAIRLPLGMPGVSASPYLSVASLIKSWGPSGHPREILMITSGVDPDFGMGPGNPYLEQAIDTALRHHVIVHAIWYRSAGHAGHSFGLMNWGQIYLSQLTQETGGEFYWLGFTNPVSFTPYLNELNQELSGQYWIQFTAPAPAKPTFEKFRIGTEVPGVSIVGPSRVWVDPNASHQTG